MAKLKLEQTKNIEKDRKNGIEVNKKGERKLIEAEMSEKAMEQIEALDDDDKAFLEAAAAESRNIAKAVAESEIKEKGREVGESLKETTDRSSEYSDAEYRDAEKAHEMKGDYCETGDSLSRSLKESGQEFKEIAKEGSRIKNELKAEYEKIASSLEGVF